MFSKLFHLRPALIVFYSFRSGGKIVSQDRRGTYTSGHASGGQGVTIGGGVTGKHSTLRSTCQLGQIGRYRNCLYTYEKSRSAIYFTRWFRRTRSTPNSSKFFDNEYVFASSSYLKNESLARSTPPVLAVWIGHLYTHMYTRQCAGWTGKRAEKEHRHAFSDWQKDRTEATHSLWRHFGFSFYIFHPHLRVL